MSRASLSSQHRWALDVPALAHALSRSPEVHPPTPPAVTSTINDNLPTRMKKYTLSIFIYLPSIWTKHLPQCVIYVAEIHISISCCFPLYYVIAHGIYSNPPIHSLSIHNKSFASHSTIFHLYFQSIAIHSYNFARDLHDEY